jgi:O-antigen/teichoic acid export membrane protein
MKIKKITFITSAGIIGLSTLIRVFLTMLLAKELQPNELGDYAWSITIFGILGIIANYGSEQFLIQKIPKLLSTQLEKVNLIVCYSREQVNNICLMITTGLVLIYVIFYILDISTERYNTILILSLALPLAANTLIESTVIRARGYPITSQLIDSILQTTILVILAYAIFVIIKPDREIFGYDKIIAIAFLISWLVTYIATKYWYIKKIGIGNKEKINLKEKKEWEKQGADITLGVLGWAILGKSDIFIMGIIVNSKDIAAYFIFIRIAEMITFFTTVSYYIWGAKISDLKSNKNYESMQKLITNSTLLCAIISILFGILIFINSDLIIKTINPVYIYKIELLYVALFIFIIKGATGILNPLFYILEEQEYLKKIQWILGVLFTILVFLLTIRYGVMGCMIAFGTIQIIFILILIKRLQKNHNLYLIKYGGFKNEVQR